MGAQVVGWGVVVEIELWRGGVRVQVVERGQG